MSYHLITSTFFDLEMFKERANNDEGPRHMVAELATRLDATVHQPVEGAAPGLTAIAGRVYANPEQWDVVRRAFAKVQVGDRVFCSGQDVGLVAAIYKLVTRKDIHLAVSVLEPNAKRFSHLMRLLRLDKQIDLYVVTDSFKVETLRSEFGVDAAKIVQVPEQTDERFFRPAPVGSASSTAKPLIASAGREQRDYRTLAAAVSGMEIDVDICAVSPNASSKQRIAMPDVIPPNMAFNDYTFRELRELYQRCNVVILSMMENQSYAGFTVLMEAVSTIKPVIITRNEGLASEFVEKGLVLGVEPNDAEGMRDAIAHVLDNPAEAQEMAERAHSYFLKNHTSSVYVDLIVAALGGADNDLADAGSGSFIDTHAA